MRMSIAAFCLRGYIHNLDSASVLKYNLICILLVCWYFLGVATALEYILVCVSL